MQFKSFLTPREHSGMQIRFQFNTWKAKNQKTTQIKIKTKIKTVAKHESFRSSTVTLVGKGFALGVLIVAPSISAYAALGPGKLLLASQATLATLATWCKPISVHNLAVNPFEALTIMLRTCRRWRGPNRKVSENSCRCRSECGQFYANYLAVIDFKYSRTDSWK